MGVGGNFWDLLKPYARHEGVDFLREKRVAVDLPFWIVQHDAAVRSRAPHARNPHLRNTFFRTINLFSKMGAYPVFVVDGDPSPLKSQARIERFFRGSGLDPSELPKALLGPAEGEVTPVKQRNRVLTRYIQECVELLGLLGMPILRANCEAEALCAQLNNEGHVDACITADSDAFLFGAKCVIKCLRSNSKEPLECYYMSDIEAALGLKRKHLVAIALLVGNDYDLHGVNGLGVDTALRLVQLFDEDEVLDRLLDIGKGVFPVLQENTKQDIDDPVSFNESSANARPQHCSQCGHPGNKKAHSKIACAYCLQNGSTYCIEKPIGFKCVCATCDKDHKIKEQSRHESWQIRVCRRIAAEQNFPNSEIIKLYLGDSHGNYEENEGPSLRWDKPKVDDLIDFLTYHQHWEPSYVRQTMLPILSTIYLREMISSPSECLLLGDQYEFHSIQRVKIRYGNPFYSVKWKRAACSMLHCSLPDIECDSENEHPAGIHESSDLLGEPDMPQILANDEFWFLVTDENMELVQAAFPREVERFQEEQRFKETKPKRRKSDSNSGKNEAGCVQLSITEFYRTTKVLGQPKLGNEPENSPLGEVQKVVEPEENPQAGKRRRSVDPDKNLPKSVRRRLLFG